MPAPESSPRPRAYGPLAIALAVLATLAVVALGIVAGRWQYGRYQERADAVRLFEAAENVGAVPLTDLVSPGDAEVGEAEFRRAMVTGYLVSDSVTAVRGRTVSQVAALHQVAWLITPDGPVLVDIGWVPRDTAPKVELPLREVTVVGRLREQEPDDGRRGDSATRIVAAQLPAPPADAGTPFPGYLMVTTPCAETGCLDTPAQPIPMPQLSLGPHLSYAFQWWLLAALAPFAAVFLVRRDARLEREARGEVIAKQPSEAKKARALRKGPTDEDIEDAL